MKTYYTYIITNKIKSVLYIGMTNDLERRMHEHKNGLIEGFSKQYRIYYLVYYEETNDVWAALDLEKRLKKWKRSWKNELIDKLNPDWKDLSEEWFK